MSTEKLNDSIETNEFLELIGDGNRFYDELCSMIEGAKMLADFSRPEVEIFARYARAYSAQQGSPIFREGEKGTFMCIIISGKINIVKETLDKETKKIISIRAGKTMGEMAMIDDLPRSATAIAAEPVILVLITRTKFELLTQEHPDLGVKFLWKIARLVSLRLRQTTAVLLDCLS